MCWAYSSLTGRLRVVAAGYLSRNRPNVRQWQNITDRYRTTKRLPGMYGFPELAIQAFIPVTLISNLETRKLYVSHAQLKRLWREKDEN